MPPMRIPAIPSDATDPVESRMICGRSMPTTTCSASPIRSIRSGQRGEVEPVRDGLDVQAPGHPIQIDPRHHQLGQIQPIQHRLDVQTPGHPIQIDPPMPPARSGPADPAPPRCPDPGRPDPDRPADHQLGQVQPIQHRLDVQTPQPPDPDRPAGSPARSGPADPAPPRCPDPAATRSRSTRRITSSVRSSRSSTASTSRGTRYASQLSTAARATARWACPRTWSGPSSTAGSRSATVRTARAAGPVTGAATLDTTSRPRARPPSPVAAVPIATSSRTSGMSLLRSAIVCPLPDRRPRKVPIAAPPR